MAASGTALTADQINLIKRYSVNIILGFDRDVAGQLAAELGVALGLLELADGGERVVLDLQGAVQHTFELTRPGGLCVMVGSPGPGSTIPVSGAALFSERRLAGCVGGSNVPARDIPRYLRMMRQGLFDPKGFVSHRVPLEQVKGSGPKGRITQEDVQAVEEPPPVVRSPAAGRCRRCGPCARR